MNIEKMLRRSNVQDGPSFDQGLSTGLIQLNLASSDRLDVGILPGYIYLLIGQSKAGKTWLGKQILAEASINPKFDDYDLIFDNPERGDLMGTARFFGQRLAERIEPPSSRGCSRTNEEFYTNIAVRARKNKPFVWLLDSEDALMSKFEVAQMREEVAAIGSREKKEKSKGSYGVEKARANSKGLRGANLDIGKNGNIVLIIKQARTNIGPTAMFNPETRSGGVALTYYATTEFWFKQVKALKKKIHGTDRIMGHTLRITIKKNRVSGNDWSVDIPFFKSVGFDDLLGCVNFLIAEEYWKGTEEKVVAPEFEFKGSKEKLIQRIIRRGGHRELHALVAEVWSDIKEQTTVKRPSRYD